MLNAIQYPVSGQEITVQITEPRPMVPVLLSNGRFRKVLWGRSENQPGDLPFGYTVALSTLRKGEWSAYHPRRVVVPYLRFLLSKPDGQQFWQYTYPHHHLQAVVAQFNREYRLYVVMTKPDLINQTYYDEWPVTLDDKHIKIYNPTRRSYRQH
jgi:hypothetical protein